LRRSFWTGTFFICRLSHFRQTEAHLYRVERTISPAMSKGIPGITGRTIPRTPANTQSHPAAVRHHEPPFTALAAQPIPFRLCPPTNVRHEHLLGNSQSSRNWNFETSSCVERIGGTRFYQRSARAKSKAKLLIRHDWLTGSCVTPDDSQHPTLTPETNKALIYVVERATGVMRFGADGRWLGALKPGTSSRSWDPGEHHHCVTGRLPLWKGLSLHALNAKAGETYYFFVHVVAGCGYNELTLSQVDADEGKELVARAKFSASRHK
jgi:hypothetical protein